MEESKGRRRKRKEKIRAIITGGTLSTWISIKCSTQQKKDKDTSHQLYGMNIV